jgi:hypothetical protein
VPAQLGEISRSSAACLTGSSSVSPFIGVAIAPGATLMTLMRYGAIPRAKLRHNIRSPQLAALPTFSKSWAADAIGGEARRLQEKCIDIRVEEEYGVCNISFNPSHIERPGILKPVIALSD